MDLWTFIVVCALAGVIALLVNRAPFIDPPYKQFITWGIWVFVVLYIAFAILGPLPNMCIGRRC